jgi:hypothetical protein
VEVEEEGNFFQAEALEWTQGARVDGRAIFGNPKREI